MVFSHNPFTEKHGDRDVVSEKDSIPVIRKIGFGNRFTVPLFLLFSGRALLLSAIVITWRWAPVDHPNKPMSKEVAQKHKTISRRLVVGQAGIIMLVWLWQPWTKQYLLWPAAGMAVTSFTLLYVIYHPYEEGGRGMNLFNRISRLLLGNMASVILFMAFFSAGTRSLANHELKVPSKLQKKLS